jgi:hypothetical protein
MGNPQMTLALYRSAVRSREHPQAPFFLGTGMTTRRFIQSQSFQCS